MSKAMRCVVIAAIAVLAAVTTGTARADVTVTMWSFLDPNKTSPREVAMKQIIEKFEASNPGIKIKVEPQDFAAMSLKFFAGNRTGTNPDVVWINTINLGGLARSGAAADLKPLIVDKWSQADRDDFYIRRGWTAVEKQGKLLALPINHGASVIYYRKDLLRKAGIDPAGLTSWDKIRAAAKQLTVVDAAAGRTTLWGFGLPLSAEKTESTPLVISLIDQKPPAFDGCKPNYATPDGVKAIELIKGLIVDDKVTPQDSLTYTVDDITDQFAAGRYAIAISASLRFPSIAKAATFDKSEIGIIPWPTWAGDHPAPMPVSGWWIVAWSKSPHLAEAGKFIEAMVSRDAVGLWTKVGGQVPIRKSVLDDASLFAAPDTAWMKTMIDAWSAASWIEPTDCNTQRFQAGLNEAVQRVVVANMAPLDALKEAERKFTEDQ